MKYNITFPLKDKRPFGTPNPLNDREKIWIEANIKTHTVMQMCGLLRRTPKFIYDFLDEKGLQPISAKNNMKAHQPTEKYKEGYFNEKEYAKKLSTI